MGHKFNEWSNGRGVSVRTCKECGLLHWSGQHTGRECFQRAVGGEELYEMPPCEGRAKSAGVKAVEP